MSTRASEAAPAHIVIKDSPRSVDDTVTRLIGLLAGRGMNVFTVIDHSGEATAAGFDLRDRKVVIFGAPKGGARGALRHSGGPDGAAGGYRPAGRRACQ